MKSKRTKKKKQIKKTKTENKKAFFILLRYIIALILIVFFKIIYLIFTPLTLYPVYWLLKLFYNAQIFNNIILINNHSIELISACIAGSAYSLLLVLNLLTPMNKKQRIYSLIFSITSLLILNIMRILVLSLLLINDSKFFDFTHKLFWYVLSTIFVVIIWFISLKLFKIKDIPLYTDLKFFIKRTH